MHFFSLEIHPNAITFWMSRHFFQSLFINRFMQVIPFESSVSSYVVAACLNCDLKFGIFIFLSSFPYLMRCSLRPFLISWIQCIYESKWYVKCSVRQNKTEEKTRSMYIASIVYLWMHKMKQKQKKIIMAQSTVNFHKRALPLPHAARAKEKKHRTKRNKNKTTQKWKRQVKWNEMKNGKFDGEENVEWAKFNKNEMKEKLKMENTFIRKV